MIGKDKKRHLLKTVSWRIIASIITFLIALLITGEIKLALGIGALEVILKMIAYYYHERFWYNHIRIGRKPSISKKGLND